MVLVKTTPPVSLLIVDTRLLTNCKMSSEVTEVSGAATM